MGTISMLLSGGVFAGVTFAVYRVVRGMDRVEARVRGRLGDLEARGSVSAEPGQRSKRSARARSSEEKGPRGDDETGGRMARRLVAAGLDADKWGRVSSLAQITFVAIPLLVAVVGVLARGFDGRMALLVILLGSGFGAMLPRFVVDHLAKRRRCVVERALPDFCDLVVTCVEGGMSLEGSLQRVAGELQVAHPVLARELARVQQHVQLGGTPDEGLLLFGERADLDSVRTLASLVQQARRFGTGIGEALRGHADALREQREQRAEEMAQKAAVKIILPTMLCIFPAVFVVIAGPAAIQLHRAFAPGGEANEASE